MRCSSRSLPNAFISHAWPLYFELSIPNVVYKLGQRLIIRTILLIGLQIRQGFVFVAKNEVRHSNAIGSIFHAC